MLTKWVYTGSLLIALIGSQVFAIYLMPLTRGATAWLPTAGVMLCFAVFTVLFGRLLVGGFQLSLIVPLISAAVPLGGILVGILAYGETASLAKVGALIVACVLIGVAALM